MRIKSLWIENFMRVEDARLDDMDSWSLTLIQGENKDDPSADSNGAGKSTIPDALSWCAYGKTARGTTGDSVIRRDAKKNCAVTMIIDDGGTLYKIIRGRKHRKWNSALHVFKHNGSDYVDITQGTNALTQRLADQIMGATYEVFVTGIYAGQEAMPDLPGMTDKALKEVVEKGAGIDRLIGAYERAKKRALDQGKAVSAAEAASNTAARLVVTAESNLVTVEVSEATWQSGQATEIQKGSDLVTAKQTDAKAVKDAVQRGLLDKAAAKRAEAQAIADDAEPARLRYESSLQASRAAESAKNAAASAVIIAKTRLTTAQRDVDRAVKGLTLEQGEVKKIDGLVGQPCASCAVPLAPDSLASVRLSHLRALKGRVEEHKAAQVEHADAEASLMDLDAKLAEAAKALEDANAFSDSQRPPPDAIVRINALNAEAKGFEDTLRSQLTAAQNSKRDLDEALSALDKLKNAVSPYAHLIAGAKVKITEAQAAHQAAVLVVGDESRKLELFRSAVDVFGPSGVRAHILDTVTPFLNDRTGHYLGTLSDGNILAEWSTIGFTKSEELREEFNIRVTNLQGADEFSGLSGGEKRKVRLATNMALQDLIATRATKPIELYIGDEIDDALDSAALERLMNLLEEKAKARGPVLLISHADLKAWVRDTITVVKEGGVSKFVADAA